MTREESKAILSEIESQCCDANSIFNTLDWEQRIKALDMAIQALEQTKWIPVSEGLPETDDDVLITADNGEIYLGFIYKYDSKSWYINSKEYHEPIAWMPLPSTYQLQERNEE